MEIIAAVILVITNRWLDVLDRRGLVITVAIMAGVMLWAGFGAQSWWIVTQSGLLLLMAASRLIRLRPRSTTL